MLHISNCTSVKLMSGFPSISPKRSLSLLHSVLCISHCEDCWVGRRWRSVLCLWFQRTASFLMFAVFPVWFRSLTLSCPSSLMLHDQNGSTMILANVRACTLHSDFIAPKPHHRMGEICTLRTAGFDSLQTHYRVHSIKSTEDVVADRGCDCLLSWVK